MNTPRNYKDENELHAMCDLLMAGRKANNGSYYIHPGDLKWWLYYPPLEGAFWDHIYLWDDSNQPGRLLGWLLISPDWVGIDVYIQPEFRGSAQSVVMYGWAEQQAIKIARQKGKSTLHVLWISHQDDFLGAHFGALLPLHVHGGKAIRILLSHPLQVHRRDPPGVVHSGD